MAVIAYVSAPNFAQGDYHRLREVEFVCGEDGEEAHYILHMDLYHNVSIRNLGRGPVYTSQIRMSLAEMGIDMRDQLYPMLASCPMFAGLAPVSDEP